MCPGCGKNGKRMNTMEEDGKKIEENGKAIIGKADKERKLRKRRARREKCVN